MLDQGKPRHDPVEARHQRMMLALPPRRIEEAMNGVFQHVRRTAILLDGQTPHSSDEILVDIGGYLGS